VQVPSAIEMPSLSEFLLTASDLLNLQLSARLVVISSGHARDHHGWATSDGIMTLTRALLVAGAQCVLVSLWPVPDMATKILLRAFYSALLQVWDPVVPLPSGICCSRREGTRVQLLSSQTSQCHPRRRSSRAHINENFTPVACTS
jgi:hypothetical protein